MEKCKVQKNRITRKINNEINLLILKLKITRNSNEKI